MKKDLTEIVFILDRSGSMANVVDDTIGGFNSLLKKHQELPGECLVSTVLFDNDSEVLHDRLDIKDIKPITSKEYYVRGCTALLDAIGGAIHHIGNIHKYIRNEDVPEKTIFVVTTDGMENASKNYDYKKVKEMIERQQSKYQWEFIFLGANIDACREANRIGINKDFVMEYENNTNGITKQYECMSEAIRQTRFEKKVSKNWKNNKNN